MSKHGLYPAAYSPDVDQSEEEAVPLGRSLKNFEFPAIFHL